MPTPFFADLVRELCRDGGTGALMPTGAVPGHRCFAGHVPADRIFHYAVAGIVHPGEWETGLGRIDAEGRLVRESVAASSSGGMMVDFRPGLKTIALTVGAGWFAARDAAAAALEEEAATTRAVVSDLAGDVANAGAALAALGGDVAAVEAAVSDLNDAIEAKQPISTGHDTVTEAAESDLLTVRRGSGWVNLPLAALIPDEPDEPEEPEEPGVVVAAAGSAAAPSIGFADDGDTGLFHAGADEIGFAVAGSERMRLDEAGQLGIGTSDPGVFRLNVVGGAFTAKIESASEQTALALNNISAGGREWYLVTGGSGGSLSGGKLGIYDMTAMQIRLQITGAGEVCPGADNNQPLGLGSHRWSTLYAATGTINTSDSREKLWQGPMTGAEQRAARRIAAELGFFQWNDAIAWKGAAAARRHFGVRAQAVWAIMADEGLIDPIDEDGRPGATPYAFLCWDNWEDEAVPADRFGIRADQLALFLIAGIDARLALLEAAI
ncbi:MAG: hypothetical protein DI569_03925 [Sphingopyxis macrogoltabida]|uniref:Peptidase S74 domain-containing protein n=1 Tax=Sphingopyxis macrogoltabida TaxID=33050 RepID=A0A2W5L7Y7_SPHMC|nr:MAG: hypothetical protein DI569_03925 [Sphingopyxis macrogoltabida]